jgi:GNAT superfamily N-acetyltransferase
MGVVDLGDGLTERPLTAGDATAVFEVIAAQELADLGVVEIEEADIVGNWQRPSFDVSSGTVGIFDGDRLVAYAEVAGDRGDAAVDPAYRGRGIGTALAAWTQAKARSNGATEVGMPVPEGSPGDRLLDALGYRVRWTSWVLKLPEGRTIEARTLPAGYIIREAAVAEYRDVWTVVEDAFLEWSRRERESFEDFAATVTERPGFEPWNLRVVVDPTGAVVGVSFVLLAGSAEAYVSKLAVRRDQRGRGLAQALLVDSFAQARAHGAKVSGLATDSRTGALGLYTKVGMEPTSVWVNRGIAL